MIDRSIKKRALYTTAIAVLCACLFLLSGCDGAGGGGQGTSDGPAFEPGETLLSSYDPAAAISGIDTSSAANGYVGAATQSSSRLKFVVSKDGVDYNYDMTNDGSATIFPLNMGNGTYSLSIMQNTRDNMYVTLASTSVTATLNSEFEPFLRPNTYCNYTTTSACVKTASELTSGAANEGEALGNIYSWVVKNVKYDTNKATTVAKGYVPDPDSTLSTKMGICFDYASLTAAMLRSQGIPCKIITGYVSSGNIYHAWNMVYIDGTWKAMQIEIPANTWSRIDTTFAAGGDTSFVGDGSAYTDSLTY